MNKFNGLLLALFLSFVSFGFAMEHDDSQNGQEIEKRKINLDILDNEFYRFNDDSNDYTKINVNDTGEITNLPNDELDKNFTVFIKKGDDYEQFGEFDHKEKKIKFSRDNSSEHKDVDSCFKCSSSAAMKAIGIGIFIVCGGWLFKYWYDNNNKKNSNTKTLEE